MVLPKGYVKLDRSILLSTVWAGQAADVKILWITLLCLMDADGCVYGSVPGLAKDAQIDSLERVDEILAQFMAPDPYSRSKEHEGRRLEVIDRGWRVLNAPMYYGAQSPRQMADAERKRRFRAEAAGGLG